MNERGREDRARSLAGASWEERRAASEARPTFVLRSSRPSASRLGARKWVSVARRPEAVVEAALLEALDEAVLVADPNLTAIFSANAAAAALLGYDAKTLGRLELRALFASARPELSTYVDELRTTGAARRSFQLQRADGSLLWVELKARLQGRGVSARSVLVLRDLTQDLQCAERIQTLEAELAAARAQRLHENRLVALGQIAAGVAHELNNPASYVLMNLDEIAETLERAESAHKSLRMSLLAWLEGEQRERAAECLSGFPLHRVFQEGRELVAECVDGVERIGALVKDLRGFARIEESDVSVLTLNDVVLTACKMVGSHVRRVAELRMNLHSGRHITADRRRLVQVVTNLLMNAAQAVEQHRASTQVIEVATFDADDAVILQVHDTGPGVAPELATAIFEPFFTTKRGSGTGLGLFLCADIVRQHAGTLTVQSQPGSGATFEVRLPLDTGLAVAAPPRPAPLTRAHDVAAHVLVIDDEPHLIRAYERVLSRHHHVTVATDGAAALELIERSPTFDAILCDLSMPDVDGVRIYRCLDRIAPELKPRVIFSSGGALTRRAEELLSSIDNPLLEKPVSAAKLLAAIESVRKSATTRVEAAPLAAGGGAPKMGG